MEEKRDIRTFFALCLWMLVPSVYLLIRMHIVSVHEVDMNILVQMEWFDLIDEIITTAFITPLYFLLKNKDSKKNGFSFMISFGVYFLFTVIISLYIGNIASFMKAEYAKEYLLMQAVSMLIAFIGTFVILLFTIYEDYKSVVLFTMIKLILLALFDYLLIPMFKDLGASYSEIIVNMVIAIVSILVILKRNIFYLLSAVRISYVPGLKKGLFPACRYFWTTLSMHLWYAVW